MNASFLVQPLNSSTESITYFLSCEDAVKLICWRAEYFSHNDLHGWNFYTNYIRRMW